MRDKAGGVGRVLLAGVVALCGLWSVGASTAWAAPSYRLAFGSTVQNAASAGPLIVKGHRSGHHEPMIADQVIEHTDGSKSFREAIGQLVYEEYPGSLSHRHWHYKGFMRYQLRSTSDLSLVRPDNKAGFCLSDPEYAPDYCGVAKPDALEVGEGLGPGRVDYYKPHLEGQYIDVTGVPPGDYWLVHWANAGKEICESDYENNAAAIKLTLWPNGYGVAPYFTPKEAVEPFSPPLFGDLSPPEDCPPWWSPTPKLPDLLQKPPTELDVTVLGDDAHTPPDTGAPSAPTLTKRAARRYVVKALTKRFHRRPRKLRQACRRVSRTSFVCRVRWKHRRYRYRGSVKIFTVHTRHGFERRANLRVRRIDTRCAPGRRCSRTFKAKNLRL